MALDVIALCPTFPKHDVQHAIEEAHIRAGLDGQVQIAHLRCVGLAGVHTNDFEFGIDSACCFNASKKNGVSKGGIRAGNEEASGMVNVFIAGRWCVGTECHLVASHRRAHAQARVGVDVVGSNQAFGQFVKDVIIFRQELT